MSKKDTQKKDYSKIEVKDNMNVKDQEESNDISEKRPEKAKQLLAEAPKKRKKGLMERLVVGFLGPEGLPGIGAYLNEEIIIPSIKNIIVESVTSGINMAIFGERGRPTGGTNYGQHYSPNRTRYKPETDYSTRSRTSRYTNTQPEPTKRPEMVRSIRYMVDDYPIESRMNANEVLTALTEFADKYDYVSVADYYDMIGVGSHHTDYNYGWSFDNIVRSTITPVRGGGYLINFPPVEEI